MIDPIKEVNKERLSNIKKDVTKRNLEELFELFDSELHKIRYEYGIDALQVEQLLDIKRVIYNRVKPRYRC